MTLRIETLAIGDELLDGRLADTNSQRLADALSMLGLTIKRATVIDDDIERIGECLREICARADVVVTSGGLGPTTDDLTAEAVAKVAGLEVSLDAHSLRRIEGHFKKRGLPMPPNNRRQAEVPSGARVIDNEAGISPAFVTKVGNAEVWSFPGVPREYDFFTQRHVLSALRERLPDDGGAGRAIRTVRCLGITESALGTALESFEAEHPQVRVQYRTRFPENHVRLVVEEKTQAAAEVRADELAVAARAVIGGSVYAVGERDLEVLLVEALIERGETLALAESCTGGWMGKRLVDVPGASQAFFGSVVAYAYEAKTALLGVDAELIKEKGAVSEEVAEAMARGARERLGTDWALSVTGIAGPGGGTEDKPVGTVCFGLAGPDGVFTKRRFLPLPGRDRIRSLSCSVSMRWLLSTLQKRKGPGS